MIERGAQKEILEEDYRKHRAAAEKFRERGNAEKAATHYRRGADLLEQIAGLESSDRLASERRELAGKLRDAAEATSRPKTQEEGSGQSDTSRLGAGSGRTGPASTEHGREEENSPVDADEFLENPPDLDFEDVGGMTELKQTLIDKVVDPLERRDLYEQYDLGVVNAVLLHGPPGTGKTHISRALAGKLGYQFIEVRPSDVTSSLVGEASKNVETLFDVARDNQPCIVFIDEIEAIAPQRSGGAQKTQSERQMINQLLTELTEIKGKDVIVVGATNLPDEIDDAAWSRFQERIEVPPPDPEARVAVLRIHLRNRPVLTDEIDWERVKSLTEGYTSRDLEVIASDAARAALQEAVDRDELQYITQEHLEGAITENEPSLEGRGGYQ